MWSSEIKKELSLGLSPSSTLTVTLFSGSTQRSSTGYKSFGIANPIVKNAEAIGYIKPFSYEQDRNQVRYSIDNSVAAAAGSESQLAANLDAIPVAAVHDARAPPSRSVASEQRSPVLVSKDADAEFGNSEYFLVVPTNTDIINKKVKAIEYDITKTSQYSYST
ncbi:hypothetical protein Avbf_10105 [Armadillidium vulgare]|nr:hypothetical protein Avbf_10105 [Armadillidium vulgare]